MSQQTLPCTPPPRTAEGGFIFSYRFLMFPKNVLKEKPEYFGVIQIKRPKNVFFSIFTQTKFDKLDIT